MDKPKVRLRRLPYGIITPLLNHNELLHRVRLESSTHISRLCSSTDPVVHASKHSRFGQIWVELQHSLQQKTSRNSFIYCEEEQELRCDESDEHPRQLDDNTTGGGVTFGVYAEVHSAPYAYDQGTEAKRGDPKGAPPFWFCLPLIQGVARSGSISCRILHLFRGSVKSIDLAKGRASGFTQ